MAPPKRKKSRLSPKKTKALSELSQSSKLGEAPLGNTQNLTELEDSDDNIALSALIHHSARTTIPPTPAKRESGQAAELGSQEKQKRKKVSSHPPQKREKHVKKKSRSADSSHDIRPKKTSKHTSPIQHYTSLGNLIQENQVCTVKVKVIHAWSIQRSSVTSPFASMVVKDVEDSLMQVFIPEFVVDNWKDRFSRESTTVTELGELGIDLGPLYSFTPLNNIPHLLPDVNSQTSQLAVKDAIGVIVDITPLQQRFRQGKTIKFIEAYVIDPSIWPDCALFTIWEDTAILYQNYLSPDFTFPFVLAAQHVRPNCYKGRFGYQSTSFTVLAAHPKELGASTKLLQELPFAFPIFNFRYLLSFISFFPLTFSLHYSSNFLIHFYSSFQLPLLF